MKKLLLTAMLAMVTLPVQAQKLPQGINPPSNQWLYLYSNPYNGNFPASQTDINRYYLIGGTARRVWTRTTNSWVDRSNVKTILNLTTVYCDKGKYRLDYTANYNSNGAALGASNAKLQVIDIVPGTNGETLFNAVCL